MFYAAAWPYAAMSAGAVMMLSVLEALAFFFDASRFRAGRRVRSKKKDSSH